MKSKKSKSKSITKEVEKPTEISQFMENEEIKTELKKNNEIFEEIKRQYDSIQKSLDLIYSDRNLIEGMKADIGSIRSLILTFDKHNENLTQDLKKEVIDTGSKVEQSAEEVKDTVDYKTDQIREHVGEVKNMKTRVIKGKGILRRFFGLFERLKSWKRR